MSADDPFKIILLCGDEEIAVIEDPLASRVVQLAVQDFIRKALDAALFRAEVDEAIREAGTEDRPDLPGE